MPDLWTLGLAFLLVLFVVVALGSADRRGR